MAGPEKTVDKRITPAFLAQAGKGRPKGVPNKATSAVKEMVLQALKNKGGVKYLELQAEQNATAFMALVGKIIPTQIAGDKDNPIAFADVTEDAERVMAMIATLERRSTDSATLQ